MSSSSDSSPKAKVSYDQDKFMVEFSVQDYTPEVGQIFSMTTVLHFSGGF